MKQKQYVCSRCGEAPSAHNVREPLIWSSRLDKYVSQHTFKVQGNQ